MPHLKRCAAAWLLVVVLPAGASAKWTELRSENFVFIGDASEGQIRRVAERLEQFREALLRVLPGASAQSPVPTVVMVFDGDRSMTPVKPLYRGKPIELNGYFQSGEDVNYIVVNAEFLDIAVVTIFHEYRALPRQQQPGARAGVGWRRAGRAVRDDGAARWRQERDHRPRPGSPHSAPAARTP